MMHGHEKSDSAIVAVKPANKALHSAAEQSTAELFAAEPAEPRAETKRNAGQQSTCGTQGRISVSQALERIRRVAKERKKEKFTSLLHHISIDLLDEAFFELKEEAAPGPHEASTAAPQKTDCCDTRSYSTGQGMRTNTGGPLQVPLADTREVGDKFDCRAGGRPPFWLVTTASGVRA